VKKEDRERKGRRGKEKGGEKKSGKERGEEKRRDPQLTFLATP